MTAIEAPSSTTCTARIWSASLRPLRDRAEQHPEVLGGADADRVAGAACGATSRGGSGSRRTGRGRARRVPSRRDGGRSAPAGTRASPGRWGSASRNRPTQSLARRFVNSRRCAASWARMLRHTWPRAISTNASEVRPPRVDHGSGDHDAERLQQRRRDRDARCGGSGCAAARRGARRPAGHAR